MKSGIRTLCAMAVAAMASSVWADNTTMYFVGNSLSQDLYANVLRPRAITHENAKGNVFTFGYHFRGGTSLTYMHNFPTAASTVSAVNLSGSSYSNTNNSPWNTALDGYDWDVVTMQPYYPSDSVTSNQGTDLTAVNGMIAEARKRAGNASTKFYVYGAWPYIGKTPYTAYTTPSPDSSSTSSTITRDYLKHLTDHARAANPGVSIGVIPAGEVLWKLEDIIKNNPSSLPSFTSIKDFHRDEHHMNAMGQNVAAWTAYAVLFKESPVGLQLDQFTSSSTYGDGTYGEHYPATTTEKEFIQQTIWDIVNSPEWIGYTTVPEPASAVLLVGGGLLLTSRRLSRRKSA